MDVTPEPDRDIRSFDLDIDVSVVLPWMPCDARYDDDASTACGCRSNGAQRSSST
jgi:hypothetical protein